MAAATSLLVCRFGEIGDGGRDLAGEDAKEASFEYMVRNALERCDRNNVRVSDSGIESKSSTAIRLSHVSWQCRGLISFFPVRRIARGAYSRCAREQSQILSGLMRYLMPELCDCVPLALC